MLPWQLPTATYIHSFTENYKLLNLPCLCAQHYIQLAPDMQLCSKGVYFDPIASNSNTAVQTALHCCEARAGCTKHTIYIYNTSRIIIVLIPEQTALSHARVHILTSYNHNYYILTKFSQLNNTHCYAYILVGIEFLNAAAAITE